MVNFFLCLWVIFALLDPGAPLKPDPIRIRTQTHSTGRLIDKDNFLLSFMLWKKTFIIFAIQYSLSCTCWWYQVRSAQQSRRHSWAPLWRPCAASPVPTRGAAAAETIIQVITNRQTNPQKKFCEYVPLMTKQYIWGKRFGHGFKFPILREEIYIKNSVLPAVLSFSLI